MSGGAGASWRPRVDRALAVLLALLSAGHCGGALATGSFSASATVWSVSGSLAAWLVALLNWLRVGRPGDRALARWALAGALAWAGLMAWLAFAASMVADPRPWAFVGTSLGLAAFAARDARRG